LNSHLLILQLHKNTDKFLERGKMKAVFVAKQSPVRWGNKKCLSVRGQFTVSYSSVFVANLGLLRIFLHSLPITAGGCEQWGMAWRSVDIRR